MGMYLNPGNETFKTMLNGIYVDKTGIIDTINSTLDTKDKLTCISRPRRFGKSYTAQLLCAYYDKSCIDSDLLFRDNGLEIVNRDSYEKHLGKYNVIYIDITGFISKAKDINNIVEDIRSTLKEELLVGIDGLQADLIQMLGGNEMVVDTSTFQNDMTSVKNRDDVLSLLIHLGYLAYDSGKQSVRIPNEEIRREFISTIKVGSHDATNRIIMNSDQLIADTINGDEAAVAKAIQEAHEVGTFGTSPLFYNNEQALRAIVKFSYISCANYYMKIEELPSGHGYADIAYIPMATSQLPAMLIELKADGSEEAALAQIKTRNYPAVFDGYKGSVILCGINYNRQSKKHTCKIERIDACQ